MNVSDQAAKTEGGHTSANSAVPVSAMVIVGIVAGLVAIGGTTAIMLQQSTPYAHARIGGAFSMIDTRGKRVTEADLRGKPSVLFFGYTGCPDVCPTTLALLTNAMTRLGARADHLNVVFISLDPVHDTPDTMRSYLSSFDPRIRGLTGTERQVFAMADAFHIYRKRVDTNDGGYTLTHTADALLLDGNERLVGEIFFGEDEKSVEAKLRTLVPEPVCRPDAPGPADLWSPSATAGPGQLCGNNVQG